MSKDCISNDINQIRNCTYNNCLKCSANKEQYKYCYWLNYKTLTGFEAIFNDGKNKINL